MLLWKKHHNPRFLKVFCVGANKTGTTSLASFLSQVGYNVAPQDTAELLIDNWARRDFTQIIRFCTKYNAFQDIPFSLPFTYQALDHTFPNSKFILTIRNSPEEWYESLVRFTMNRLNLVSAPRMSDLEEDCYRFRGFTATVTKLVYGEQTPLFDKRSYIAMYEFHNESIKRYFASRQNDLLVVNLSQKSAESDIRTFLNISHENKSVLPHLNASR